VLLFGAAVLALMVPFVPIAFVLFVLWLVMRRPATISPV
jgi:hypothetical protein